MWRVRGGETEVRRPCLPAASLNQRTSCLSIHWPGPCMDFTGQMVRAQLL